MSDSRRAALTLHALPPADRRWVLDRLAPHQRHVLAEHLAELDALRIPADPVLVRRALEQGRQNDGEPGWRDALDRCEASAVVEALRAEPAMLIARVLAAGPWSWSAPLRAALPGDQLAVVDDCLHKGQAVSLELDEWLLRAVLARCRPVEIDAKESA
jgi:hypothetical protein